MLRRIQQIACSASDYLAASDRLVDRRDIGRLSKPIPAFPEGVGAIHASTINFQDARTFSRNRAV
jgi:hypothetical protein